MLYALSSDESEGSWDKDMNLLALESHRRGYRLRRRHICAVDLVCAISSTKVAVLVVHWGPKRSLEVEWWGRFAQAQRPLGPGLN